MSDEFDYTDVLAQILEDARVKISDLKPSEWVEKNRYMTADVSPIPGPFSYDNSPYAREIIDCLANDDPSRKIAIMKGAQIGISTGVIEGAIGWIISESPGNILFLVGHDGLVSDAVSKVDRMIDNSGIRHLIKSTSQRARNTKSGDTDRMKEFPSGYLKLGIANHKELRNISMRYGFIDDFESMKGDTKQSGSTTSMIEQRFAAYAKNMKLMYISTPEIEETSNIYPVYLLGDQRKYHVKCPCCSEEIIFEWEIESEKTPGIMCGMNWKLDEKNKLIRDSVGFICYKCEAFFDDSNKSKLIREGRWIPTAEPQEEGYVSFQISSLYAPTYMFGWADYVQKYLQANPVGGERDEEKHKTFVNLQLGLPYKMKGKSIKANELQKNIRKYEIATIPEKLSIADGNGKIVLITLGCDLNGKEDDARLDYEVVAFSESGATYSIEHGSIGTFVPRDNSGADRERWTYRHGHEKSVWPVLDSILEKKYQVDTGRRMSIFMSGIDTGYQQNHAYQFVDYSTKNVVCLKGDPEGKRVNVQADLKTYRRSREKPNLYLVESNHTKDLLANYMGLKWDPTWQEKQPANFMNFPTPSGGFYLYTNYFSHYEAEEKVIDRDNKYVWKKINSAVQNHLFDCRLYASVVKDILVDQICKELKIANGTWTDYVEALLGSKK